MHSKIFSPGFFQDIKVCKFDNSDYNVRGNSVADKDDDNSEKDDDSNNSGNDAK